MNRWHTCEISDVVLETGTDVIQGRKNLSSDRKRKRNNRVFLIPSADSATIIKRMASDASLTLLVVTYLISLLFGSFKDSLVGIILLFTSFVCGSYIKYRSSLRISNSYRLLLPEAKVIENGKNMRLSIFDVEVGDLIVFSQGDIIPADARLVSSASLVVAERELNEITGRYEYRRYEKDHEYISHDQDESHCPNMVYAGAMVIAGKGSAIVSAIGKDTKIFETHGGISVVPENDSPDFLTEFLKKSRRFSLFTLMFVVPTVLISIYFRTVGEGADVNFLSMFILALALSATSMSELSISSAEAIITKELLPSSLISKIEKKQESKITKLSVAEQLAKTDTLLILSPETLIDENKLVRRIYFSGNQYRFDTLKSTQIKDFSAQVVAFYSHMSPSSMNDTDRIISDFAVNLIGDKNAKQGKAKFINNYPIHGARSCVYGFDNEGNPFGYIVKATDLSLLNTCTSFRTEGGGLWKLEQKDVADITAAFGKYSSANSLDVAVFFSHNESENGLIFEGIIAVGEEYPYCNGELTDELLEAGIHSILVLEEESDRNIEIAYNCGLCKSSSDIAIYSDYERAGLSVSDANLSAKVYVGFGRKGTQTISKRLADNSKKVLPIIKDSANRSDVSPYSGVYATHAQTSYDSVKIASSVSIMPNSSSDKRGGLSDALRVVQACSMAFLKLGIYKNYLVFSSLLRIFSVCLPIVFGHSLNVISPIALFVCGFFCDFAALISIAYSGGVPVKAKNTVSETQKLFYLSTSALTSFCSLILSAVILCTIGYMTKGGIVASNSASFFISILIITVQIASLGGFLLILRGKTRSHKFNFSYFLIFVIVLSAVVTLVLVPDLAFLFNFTAPLPAILPYIVAVGGIAFVLIVIIIGNLSSFGANNRL